MAFRKDMSDILGIQASAGSNPHTVDATATLSARPIGGVAGPAGMVVSARSGVAVPGLRNAGQEVVSRSRGSRINTLTRDMQALMCDQLPPIAVVDPRKTLKASLYRRGVPARSWRQTRFTNPARTDGLVLRHWTRLPETKRKAADAAIDPAASQDVPMVDAPAEVDPDSAVAGRFSVDRTDQPQQPLSSSESPLAEGGAAVDPTSTLSDEPPIQTEYPFAQYDDDIWVPQYTDSEYDSHYSCPQWSRAETDYLLGLIKDFGYRWPLVYDRYEFPLSTGQVRSRPVEEIKHRFYTVWARSIELNTPGGVANLSDAHFALYQSLKAYEPSADARRRAIAAQLLTRSPEEVAEETQILGELQRIVTHYNRADADLRDLRLRLDGPLTSSSNVAAFQSSANLSTLFTNLLHAERVRRRGRISLSQPDPSSAGGTNGVVPAVGSGPGGPNGPGSTPNSAIPPSAVLHSVATGAYTPGPMPSALNTPGTATWPPHSGVPAIATPVSATNPTNVGTSTAAARKASMSSSSRNNVTNNNTNINNNTPSRVLSAADERRFGITIHDRLTSGISFRSDRFVKMRQAKSQVQMHKIAAALAELGVPDVISLPTGPVCDTFERLIGTINKLLDARRTLDRLESEVRVAAAVRAGRLDRERDEEHDGGGVGGNTGGDGASNRGGGDAGSANPFENGTRADGDGEADAGDADGPDADDDDGAATPSRSIRVDSENRDGGTITIQSTQDVDGDSDDDAGQAPTAAPGDRTVQSPKDEDEDGDGDDGEDEDGGGDDGEDTPETVHDLDPSPRSDDSAPATPAANHKRSTSAITDTPTSTSTHKRSRR